MSRFRRSSAAVSTSAFPPEEQKQVDSFLAAIRAQLGLPPKHTELILQDHLSALTYYRIQGLSLSLAMARLAPENLGDFYLTERKDWYPLDHAAKIYPLSMGQKRMTVFRLSGYLQEPVVPALMQMALTYTMKRFPYFATTLKSGFFWHYLDSAMRRFVLRPETKLPCAVMRMNASDSPALRVVYYQNRVSVEFFHILADGFGGSIFLRTLLGEYLRLLGYSIPAAQGLFSLSEPPEPKEWQDAFTIGDRSPSAHGFTDKRALQLLGLPPFEKPNRVIHYNLSVSAFQSRAKDFGVTLTALMMGYLMLACKEAATPEGSRPFHPSRKIQIQLPVNMRRFYPSETLRNFSLYGSIRMHPDEITSLAAILPSISAQIQEAASKARLDETMHLSRRLVRLLRFVPLIIKRPLAFLIFGALSDSVFTTTLSNIGPIKLPPEMAPHMKKFDFVLGPPITSRASCAMCSYEDNLVFTITKNTALPTLEESLYRLLEKDGLSPYLEGSS